MFVGHLGVGLIGKRVAPAIHKEVLEASEGDSDKTALREAG